MTKFEFVKTINIAFELLSCFYCETPELDFIWKTVSKDLSRVNERYGLILLGYKHSSKYRSDTFLQDLPPNHNDSKHSRSTDVQIKPVCFDIFIEVFVSVVYHQMFFSSEKCVMLDLFFLFEYFVGVRYFSEFGYLRGCWLLEIGGRIS